MDLDSTISIKNTHTKELGQYQVILNSLYLVILPTDAAPQFLYAPINVVPEGGGPRDEVETLKVRASPTWGILANFEHTCWPQGREV